MRQIQSFVKSHRQMSRAAMAAMIAASAVVGLTASAQTVYQGTFVTGANAGKWGTASNWDSGTPNATDTIAQFPYGGSLTGEIEMDGMYTAGQLLFSNILNSGATYSFLSKPTSFDPAKGLTLATSSGVPVIDLQVAAQNVFWFSALQGNQGFEKKGPGRFTMRFNTLDQTLTGDIKISGGVLGINKDGSLGATTNNLYIGASGGPTTAKLLYETGDNVTPGTLAATRTINLTASGAQIGVAQFLATDIRASLTIPGAITDGGNGFGFTKTDGGVLILTGNNTYSGATAVNGGALVVGKTTSLPNYTTAGKVTATSGNLLVRVGGAGEWAVSDLDNLKTAIGTTNFDAGSSLGVDTTNATAPVSWAGLTGAQPYSLSKIGAGTLQITGVNNYTGGRLRLYGGTVQLMPGASLPTNLNLIFFNNSVGGGTLDLGGTSQVLTNLDDGTIGTSAITNGTLTYNNTTTTVAVLGGNNGHVTDFSGLSALTINAATTDFVMSAQNEVNATQNTINLAASGTLGGVNLIKTPKSFNIGAGPSTSNSTHLVTVKLGTSNTINAGTMQVGLFNGSGKVIFAPGLTNPKLTIRGFDGTSAIGSLLIGQTNSGTRNSGGTLDLSGGVADILATTTKVGWHFANSPFTADISLLKVDAGTFTTDTLIMAEKGGTGTLALQSTVTVAGGLFTAGSVTFGKGNTGSDVAVPLVPTLNISGGTFATSSIAPDGGAGSTNYSEASSIRTLRLSGTGTLRSLNATSDLIVSGRPDTDANATTTGNMVFIRVPSGTPTIYADANRKVTFTDTTMIADSGGATPTFGALRKAGPGGLQINGQITGGVPIKVDEGAVQVSNGTTAFNADVNSKLIVDYTGASVKSAVVANIVTGYNNGAWNGVGAGSINAISSSAAAADADKRFGLGYREASDIYGAGPTTVNGLSVDGTAIVVRYTYNGDVNLDGVVDSTDFAASLGNAANYGLTTGAEWAQGDFNYDGKVSTYDFNMLAGNFGAAALPSAVPGASLGSVVPEPTTLSVLAIGASLILRRRR